MSNDTTHAALTPEMQAMINSMITGAIKDALSAMGPIIQSVALTPEKLLEMERLRRAPSESQEKAIAREKRERALMKEDLDEARRNTERTQKTCTHKDKNMRWAVSLIHNFPDRQARGVCTHCHLMIEPTHWEIGTPDERNPRGKARIVEAHPLYHIVTELESTPQ
jgi:hypothetical protein